MSDILIKSSEKSLHRLATQKVDSDMSVHEIRIQKVLREEEDVKRLGVPVKYMCISLACKHHESLHGELLDIDTIKRVFSLNTVPDDCRCGITQILVDKSGVPLNPGVVERAKSQVFNKK